MPKKLEFFFPEWLKYYSILAIKGCLCTSKKYSIVSQQPHKDCISTADVEKWHKTESYCYFKIKSLTFTDF